MRQPTSIGALVDNAQPAEPITNSTNPIAIGTRRP
jgi:hypothetical protein